MTAVTVGLILALAGTASAKTGFQALVTAHNPARKPCSNGEFICGTADIVNYGAATWTFSLTSLTEQGACATYGANVTFELADSSALVLDESGTACGPGSSNLSNASSNSFGHPAYATGSWTVQTADGQFAGMTGSGTDALHIAGAHAAGTYTGTSSP